jgi:hypothetical protein
MKEYLRKFSVLVLIAVLALANPISVLADEGEGGHGLEMEVNGYHVTLSSENEWVKGENAIVVILTDSMGMPVSDADVEIRIAPKVQAHVEENSHDGESSDSSMPGMDMGEPQATAPSVHDEEIAEPVAMSESHDPGVYVLQTHLESAGEHDIQVFFHVNSEMLEANFIVDVPGMASKTLILWSFVMINTGLVVSAGVLKKQSIPVKGK